MFDPILFDLDGTLTDSAPGILHSAEYALRTLGFPVPGRATLRRFVGPPLTESFQTLCGLSAADASRAVEAYRVYFRARGMFENRVYDGIPALLRTITRAGRTLALATSKPEVFARQILDHFGLAQYFAVLAGATLDPSRQTKAAVLARALCLLEEAGLPAAAARPVLVGDRLHDVEGAAAHGLPCIGVLYGYGSEEELRQVGARAIAPTVEELAALLLG